MSPPPLVPGGGRRNTLAGGGEGVGGPNSDEGTDTVVLLCYKRFLCCFVRYEVGHTQAMISAAKISTHAHIVERHIYIMFLIKYTWEVGRCMYVRYHIFNLRNYSSLTRCHCINYFSIPWRDQASLPKFSAYHL